MSVKGGWIGVDLDGTLAHYDTWRGLYHIGFIIEEMKTFVQMFLDKGYNVKIFTARVAPPTTPDVVKVIQDWLVENGLPRLEVTCVKDRDMIVLYDDRAVQVVANTGRIVTFPTG